MYVHISICIGTYLYVHIYFNKSVRYETKSDFYCVYVCIKEKFSLLLLDDVCT